MQFFNNGPDIPERLLQAHEDGQVVFFCGAGISYPAKLPGFAELVKQIFSVLAVTPNDVQHAAIKAGQFDTAINLLETDIVGGRETVRNAMADILTPDFSAKNSTTTHDALLTLSRNRDGQTRLITTNFDRIFEKVITDKNLPVKQFQAPLLPIPKKRWDGLVYLHGLLTEKPTPSELDLLVVSSGDFGLAYLTERWASRFVSELFRNCTVCFVGYSINDPVLRYMMDALAADRQLGENPPEMYAFGSYSKGSEDKRTKEWQAKNVTAILYKEHRHHFYLHKTLRAWAEVYRDGIRGKERIVVESAISRPLAGTKQDGFVGRLLWALSDQRGLPAKRFAEQNPVPSLDWLGPLSEPNYGYTDLNRFGVTPNSIQDNELSFSLARRPSPYGLASQMALVGSDVGTRWDEVMRQLARWLVRHLNDPNLLLWLVKRGGQLHEDLARMIEYRLDELTDLKRNGNTTELEHISTNAPNAIPSQKMQTLWRLILSGRVNSRAPSFSIYRWCERFKRDGLTATLRLELRKLLDPRVYLREPFRWPEGHNGNSDYQQMKDLVEWEVVLSTDHVHSSLSALKGDQGWTEALPDLLPDFSLLLHDALDLKRELGGAEDNSDLSYMDQPSISQHTQNRGFHDWTVLIELTRDAWLATSAISPEQARLIAESWSLVPYPLFRRLEFFAATQESVIPHRQALDWLLANGHWWLWSTEVQRELIRLLVTVAPQMTQADLDRLVQAILTGPPRTMFREDIESEKWDRLVEREIWLRLAKIFQTGATLNGAAKDRLDELSKKYPEWELEADESDEFPVWIGDGDEWRTFVATPQKRRELIEWLKQPPSTDHWQEDDWRERCRDDFATTACALCALAHEDIWPEGRWREALQAWSDEKLVKRTWRYMAPVVGDIPDVVLQECTHAISRWLQSISKTLNCHEILFFNLAHRILSLDHQDGIDTDDPVSRAINHPVGHVTEALLNCWHQKTLEDGQGLPNEISSIFTELCNTQIDKFRHARVILSAHVIALFRVDREWAEEHLLPLFNWQQSEAEAKAAWEGFLWSPRLYGPLMEAIKLDFLETAQHYASLGKHDGQYAALLTFSALDPGDIFTTRELALATRALTPDGLQNSAQALVRTLEGAGDQRADYWANRVAPYLRTIWPKTLDDASAAIAGSLGRLCVAAQDAFPDALKTLHGWLQPPTHPDYLVHLLHESNLSQKFPEEALELLNLIVSDQTQWLPSDLGNCLNRIIEGSSELETDPRYERLMVFLRQHQNN